MHSSLSPWYRGCLAHQQRKLWARQAAEKRMKMVGQVELPQEAFLAVLEMDEQEVVMVFTVVGELGQVSIPDWVTDRGGSGEMVVARLGQPQAFHSIRVLTFREVPLPESEQ